MKGYLKAIEKQFENSDKALANTLLIKMCSTKFNGSKGVREHIMEMRDIDAQLKLLEIEMSESFMVPFTLNSLPSEYRPFKISYNTHKKKWLVNELLARCVQEEKTLNQERIESAHLATQEKKLAKKDKGKAKVPFIRSIRALSSSSFARRKDI